MPRSTPWYLRGMESSPMPRWLRKEIKRAEELGIAPERRADFARVAHVWSRVMTAYYWSVTIPFGLLGILIPPGLFAIHAIDMRFYQTSAQLIPLLTITLAIQQRFFTPMSTSFVRSRMLLSEMSRVWSWELAVLLVGGETCALYRLTGSSGAERLTFAIAVAALVAGAFAVLVAPLIRVSAEEEEWAATQPVSVDEWPRGQESADQ